MQLSSWKTFTDPNPAQLPFLYVITQTLETVNDELEFDYLHLLKTNFIIKLKHLQHVEIENGVMQQKTLECSTNLSVIKIISISYPHLMKLSRSLKDIMKQ